MSKKNPPPAYPTAPPANASYPQASGYPTQYPQPLYQTSYPYQQPYAPTSMTHPTSGAPGAPPPYEASAQGPPPPYSAVEGRDEEIERLNRMLDGGRPSDVVALEARNRANERMISHLNIQIDFMQQKTRELERKYRDAVSNKDQSDNHVSKLKSRNDELEMELQDVDRFAKRLETDKHFVVKTADKEMLEAKGELEKSRHELEDLDMEIAQYKAESQRLAKDCTEMKLSLGTKTGDLLRLEELHDRVAEDKKRLRHRTNKLMANEKELVLEIERLKRKNGPMGAGKKGKIPSKLDAFVRSVEEERNYYRDQAEAFQKMLRGEIPSTRSRSPPRSKPTSRSASPARETPTMLKNDKKYPNQGPQIPQTSYPQPQPATIVHQNLYDGGARFDGIAQPSIPPPPPGVAPNAAQMATAQGQTVVGTQERTSWLTGPKNDGGWTWGGIF